MTTKQIQQFNTYRDLLILWNQKFNLTAITDPAEVEKKHFEDSLTYAEAIKFSGFDINSPLKIADVGSGGGFPGIPLKIMYPHFQITLVEATAKKCHFLEEVKKDLDLKDLFIVNSRVENVTQKFDIVLARAIAPLEKLTVWCLPLLKPGGVLITQKGLAEVATLPPTIMKFPFGSKVFVIVRK